MDYGFGEESQQLSQVLMTRHGDLFELRSTHRFDRVRPVTAPPPRNNLISATDRY